MPDRAPCCCATEFSASEKITENITDRKKPDAGKAASAADFDPNSATATQAIAKAEKSASTTFESRILRSKRPRTQPTDIRPQNRPTACAPSTIGDAW